MELNFEKQKRKIFSRKRKKVMKKKKKTGRAKQFLQRLGNQLIAFFELVFSSNLIILGTGTERETYLSVSLYKK